MALPEIGTLYTPFSPGNLPPTYTQPGGPGTLVYPQQPMGERSAQYSFACGHWFNIPRIWEVYDDVNKEQAALICCPMCGLVQRIIEPYSEFDDYIQNPIIVA
jgi:hypothetical protein